MHSKTMVAIFKFISHIPAQIYTIHLCFRKNTIYRPISLLAGRYNLYVIFLNSFSGRVSLL